MLWSNKIDVSLILLKKHDIQSIVHLQSLGNECALSIGCLFLD